MLRESVSIENEDNTAPNERTTNERERAPRHSDWRAVDQALRTIARRRAALDADEARWLREAERLQIWRQFGMVNALDYLERVLGRSLQTAFAIAMITRPRRCRAGRAAALSVTLSRVMPSWIDMTLTPRQYEIAILVTRGCTNREIAAMLGISINAVKKHLSRAMILLEATNRTELAAIAGGWPAELIVGSGVPPAE